jgi:hypothetical protein
MDDAGERAVIPFAHVPGECYWIWCKDAIAKLEQHRRMIREREKLVREFRRIAEKVAKCS